MKAQIRECCSEAEPEEWGRNQPSKAHVLKVQLLGAQVMLELHVLDNTKQPSTKTAEVEPFWFCKEVLNFVKCEVYTLQFVLWCLSEVQKLFSEDFCCNVCFIYLTKAAIFSIFWYWHSPKQPTVSI